MCDDDVYLPSIGLLDHLLVDQRSEGSSWPIQLVRKAVCQLPGRYLLPDLSIGEEGTIIWYYYMALLYGTIIWYYYMALLYGTIIWDIIWHYYMALL